MRRILILNVLCFLSFYGQTQEHIGTGSFSNVTVTSSDPDANGMKTINGDGYELETQLASRFLAHATLGFTMDELEQVTQSSLESWIDDQLQQPLTTYTLPTVEIIFDLYDQCMEMYGDDCDQRFNVNSVMWRYAWSDHMMHKPDKLRQRVAMALSEILVVSDNSQLTNSPHGLAFYFDALMKNTFGNYEDLLVDVTYTPAMGFYLSHFNNPKSEPALNRRPDENYAREIMQLFTIGLHELNQDGTRKIDQETGLWIPTYDNTGISELAKVFTGLSGSKWQNDEDTRTVEFGRRVFRYSFIDPMIMYEDFHEQGTKTIVGGHTIRAGQSGDEDIEEAINVLFNHNNIGPFLSTRLIQRLIKSNPSPEYVERMADVFDDNGSGVRGDLGALVKAILLDEEAIECYRIDQTSNGMLRNPSLRYSQMVMGLQAKAPNGKYWNSGLFFQEQAGHFILSAPSAFNFYTPDYVPDAGFALYDLVGPEFQILNSSTSSNYVNWMLLALNKDYFDDRFDEQFPDLINESSFIPYINDNEEYEAKFTDPRWLSLAEQPDQLLDYLDLLLANGQLSDQSRARFNKSLSRSDLFNKEEAAKYGLFLIMIDPDYLIMK